MKRIAFGFALALAVTGPVAAQAPAKPPCGDDVCPTEEAATLKAAYLSPATLPEQRTKMLAIIAAHTVAGATDWVGANSEYFAWRRSGLSESQTALEDGLKENARLAAAKRANAEPYEFRKQIGVRLSLCVSDLVAKNYQQSFSPEDIAIQIIGRCIRRAESDMVFSKDAAIAARESGNTPEIVAERIRLLRRPPIILSE